LNAQEVKNATETFAKVLSGKLGDTLEAVVLYGSLAKGDYNPKSSDHNVALVLKNDDAQTLRHIAAAMRHSRPSKKTNLLLLTHEELSNARDVFPLKLRDIARHHDVVFGQADALNDFDVDNEHLALDIEGQMRGLVIRLRRLFIRGENNTDLLRQNLTGAFRAFLPPMAGLVELSGKGSPVTKADIVGHISSTLDVSDAAAKTLLDMLQAKAAPSSAGDYDSLLDGTTKMLRAAAEKADQAGGAA